MSLASAVAALAGRLAQEFNTIRTEITGRQPANSNLTTIAALAPTNGTFLKRVAGAWTATTLDAADVTTGTVDPARLPAVPGSVVAATVGTSVTLDAATGSIRNLTTTGATLAVAAPTNGAERQVLRVAVKRSTAAATTVNFDAAIGLSTGLTTRAYPIPSGKALFAALEFSSLTGGWTLVAATVTT